MPLGVLKSQGVLLEPFTVLTKLHVPIIVLPEDPTPPMPGVVMGQGVLLEPFTVLIKLYVPIIVLAHGCR